MGSHGYQAMMWMNPVPGTNSWVLLNEYGGLPHATDLELLLVWLASIGADYKRWAYTIEFFDPKIQLLVQIKHPQLKIPRRLDWQGLNCT